MNIWGLADQRSFGGFGRTAKTAESRPIRCPLDRWLHAAPIRRLEAANQNQRFVPSGQITEEQYRGLIGDFANWQNPRKVDQTAALWSDGFTPRLCDVQAARARTASLPPSPRSAAGAARAALSGPRWREVGAGSGTRGAGRWRRLGGESMRAGRRPARRRGVWKPWRRCHSFGLRFWSARGYFSKGQAP